MRAALLIAHKDLVQRMRDKSVFIYAILAPFGLALIFSFVFGPLDDMEFHATYAIVNQDDGPIATAFTGMLDSLEKEGIATVVKLDSAEQARERIEHGANEISAEENGRIDAAFVLPPGLSDSVMSGEGGKITVIAGVDANLETQAAYSLASAFSAEIAAIETAVHTVIAHDEGALAEPGGVSSLADEAAATALPVSLKDITADTRQLSQSTYFAAGMSVFFLFFTVAFGVNGLLDERRVGTMSRLLTAPVNRRQIIAGKVATSFVLGIVSMTVMVVATTALLGAEWGHPLGVALLVVSVVVAVMGILCVVAAFTKTQVQAENLQSILSLVLAIPGGAFFPVAQMGGALERLSVLTPHAWFLRGLGDLATGEVSAVFPSALALLAFGLVTAGISWPLMIRSMRR